MPQTAILASLQLILYHALPGIAMETHKWHSSKQRMVSSDTHIIPPVKRDTFAFQPRSRRRFPLGDRFQVAWGIACGYRIYPSMNAEESCSH